MGFLASGFYQNGKNIIFKHNFFLTLCLSITLLSWTEAWWKFVLGPICRNPDKNWKFLNSVVRRGRKVFILISCSFVSSFRFKRYTDKKSLKFSLFPLFILLIVLCQIDLKLVSCFHSAVKHYRLTSIFKILYI